MATLDLNDPVFIPYESNIKLDVRAKQQVNKNQSGNYEMADIENCFVVKQNFIQYHTNDDLPSRYFCNGIYYLKDNTNDIFIPPTINEGISNTLSFLGKYAGITTEEKEQSPTLFDDWYHNTFSWYWDHHQFRDSSFTRLNSPFIEFEYKHVWSDVDVIYQQKATQYRLEPIASYEYHPPAHMIMFDTTLDRVYLIPNILESSIYMKSFWYLDRVYDIPEECRLYLKTNTGAYVKVGDMFNKWHRIRILCGSDAHANQSNDPNPVYINNNIHSTDPSQQYWYFNFDGYCIDMNVKLNNYTVSPSYLGSQYASNPNVQLDPNLISTLNNSLVPFPHLEIGGMYYSEIRDEQNTPIYPWSGNPVNGNQYYEGIYVDHFTIINDLNIPDPDRVEITL